MGARGSTDILVHLQCESQACIEELVSSILGHDLDPDKHALLAQMVAEMVAEEGEDAGGEQEGGPEEGAWKVCSDWDRYVCMCAQLQYMELAVLSRVLQVNIITVSQCWVCTQAALTVLTNVQEVILYNRVIARHMSLSSFGIHPSISYTPLMEPQCNVMQCLLSSQSNVCR